MKFTTKIIIATISFFFSIYINAQDIHCEDYSTSSGWSQVSTGTSISNGAVTYNQCWGGLSRRIYKNHGVNLTYSWKLNFDFIYSNVGFGGPGHILAALTDGNLDPISNQAPWNQSNQDAIYTTFASNNHTNNPSSFLLQVFTKNNTNLSTPSAGIILQANTQYYITMERFNEKNGRLTAYSNPQRTTKVGSVCFSILADVTSNLTHLQHGVISWGSADRNMTATVDNTCLEHTKFNGGEIAGDQQIYCGKNPSALTNISSAVSTLSSETFTYRWEQSVDCSETWTAIPEATNLTYTPQNVNKNTCYRRVAYGPCSTITYSNIVHIDVTSNPLLYPQFIATIDCPSNKTSFSVSATANFPTQQNITGTWTVSEIDQNDQPCCSTPVTLTSWEEHSTNFGGFSFLKDHHYKITRTVTDKCSETATHSEIVFCKSQVGLEESFVSTKTKFQIFPNPTNGDFQIEILNPRLDDKISYEILDTKGTLIVTGKFENSTNIEKITLKDYSGGMYYLKFSINGEKVITDKIVVMK